ncbi:Mitochondrial Translation Optimization [Hypoxylon texense]
MRQHWSKSTETARKSRLIDTAPRLEELTFHKILSDHNLAATLLVRFPNGHAYQYVTGTVCSVRDIAKERIWRGVARELARWHAILPRPGLTEERGAHSPLQSEPNVWSTARKWLAALPDDADGDKMLKDSLLEEFEFLKLKLLPNGSQQHSLLLDEVFGHGDLLCGNIILQESIDEVQRGAAASVQFIDYE